MIFIWDQNHAFLESSIIFICHVALVLIFLHFLVGKGDFCPGICWFECGLFTHLSGEAPAVCSISSCVMVLNTSLSRKVRMTQIPTPKASFRSTLP